MSAVGRWLYAITEAFYRRRHMPAVAAAVLVAAIVTSPLAAQDGDQPTLAVTSTALVAAGGTINGAPAVQMTATVTVPGGTSETPTGMVEFFDGMRSLGLALVLPDDNGALHATLTKTVTSAPTVVMATATYLGDDRCYGSHSNPVAVALSAPPPAQ